LSIDEIKENIVDALEMYFEDIREQYHPDGDILQEEELVFA
jgi:hypothetical protein